MENFIVSARKYRPSTFEMVVGQHTITKTLKNAIRNNQLAQSFLFCGPRGVGKTTCARILAKTINCVNLTPEFEACNECISCKSFNELTSFNIHELDAASNNGVEDIRSLVEQVRIPPQAGKYKVYIIDEVHMLSMQAFNAFLKTLEEPPAYAKFILATTEKHRIIPTILSRCQIFDFRRITVEDIAHHLAYVAEKENIVCDADALHLVAQKADGALRDALSIFDQIAISSDNRITYQAVLDNLNILDYEVYFDMTDRIMRANTTEALNLIDEVIDRGFEGHIFLSGFSSHLRNLLVCTDESTIRLLESSENIKNKYREYASRCTIEWLFRMLDITGRTELNYKNSNNKRLTLEMAFIQMCTNPVQSISGSKEAVAPVKKSAPAVALKPQASNVTPTPVAPPPKPEPVSRPNAAATVIPADIISIKKPEKPTATSVEEPAEMYGNEPFTQDDMLRAWKSMSEIFRSQPSFYASLIKRPPVLKDSSVIEITVDNKVQINDIHSRKSEILTPLRKQLKNGDIMINAVLTASPEQSKPYTSDEKFRKMNAKNPALNKLKNELDLELDY